MRFLKNLLCIFFPWIVLLGDDNPGGALVALVMQVTLIGWPFAASWALRIEKEKRQAAEKAQKERMEAQARKKQEGA